MRRKYNIKEMIMNCLFKLKGLSDSDREIYNRIMGCHFNQAALKFIITKEEHEKIRNSAYKYIIP